MATATSSTANASALPSAAAADPTVTPKPTTNSDSASTPNPDDTPVLPTETLGALGNLPPELRLEIYDLAINAKDAAVEVDPEQPCDGVANVQLVCKHMHRETRELIQARGNDQCSHVVFMAELQSHGEGDWQLLRETLQGRGSTPVRGHVHDITQAEFITFDTTDLAKDAPVAVMCSFDLKDGIRFEVDGGGDARRDVVIGKVSQALRSVDTVMRSGTATKDDVLDALTDLADEVRIAASEEIYDDPRFLGP